MRHAFLLILHTVGVLGLHESSFDRTCDASNITYVETWPDPGIKFGQLSAVSLDISGNVYVFHRGKHVWDFSTFAPNNSYLKIGEGPVLEDAVVVLNRSNGNCLNSWGKGLFYIPHGLTVDHENNVWLTDVALHQVFKYSWNGSHYFTLGERFINGDDNEHFCKPTSVAVLSNGDFFVADGYCNSRIIKFSSSGNFLSKWGAPNLQAVSLEKQPRYNFNVPHALTLIENSNQICVADRENGRILCFNQLTGEFASQYSFLQLTGSRLFSLSYAPVRGGLFYVVNGPPLNPFYNASVGGFVVSAAKNSIVNYFEPGAHNLENPHDIAVTKDGSEIYVVELSPYKVHKFRVDTRECKGESGKRESLKASKSSYAVTSVIMMSLFVGVLFFAFLYRFYIKDKRKYKSFDHESIRDKNDEMNMHLM